MSDGEQIESRELIEDLVEYGFAEPVQETIIEEEVKPVKANIQQKQKQNRNQNERTSRNKNIKPIKEEEPEQVVEETPIVEDRHTDIDNLKEMVQCPDGHLNMTQHTLRYIHGKKGFCKANSI